MISINFKNTFKIMLLLFLSLLSLGCSIILPEEPVQQDQPVKIKETNNVNTNNIEPKPAIVIPPLTINTQTTQNNNMKAKEKDIVQEAYERYQKQRDKDQEAKQSWWNSVHDHQKDLIEMNQNFQKEMSNLTNQN